MLLNGKIMLLFTIFHIPLGFIYLGRTWLSILDSENKYKFTKGKMNDFLRALLGSWPFFACIILLCLLDTSNDLLFALHFIITSMSFYLSGFWLLDELMRREQTKIVLGISAFVSSFQRVDFLIFCTGGCILLASIFPDFNSFIRDQNIFATAFLLFIILSQTITLLIHRVMKQHIKKASAG